MIAATRLDAIVQETGRLDLTQVRFRVRQRYGFLFDVDEESDQSDYEGTLAQGLALLNGSVVATGASVLPGSALSQVLAVPGDDALRDRRALPAYPLPVTDRRGDRPLVVVRAGPALRSGRAASDTAGEQGRRAATSRAGANPIRCRDWRTAPAARG